ncbi:glycoside hydrolase family 15 protein [Tropicimonas isoalkanivorans]|uniref:glucan 1,4-alpha-glucosidase n=1 Tax=Tropicimonas isoalkanivorans TaxID=441112 RepID=A0A1I1EFG5_9RHOB|nr:glycoside hydrolase family 15 protein [Tropicimonas isoalkanivorans]SFB85486.1 glucoamylase [Tropicimonas isoalkanivorans]
MRAATSATGLTRHREGFGWTVHPVNGSILASTQISSWDPEPDYFHHWIRDAAIVLRAVPKAIEADPESRAFWLKAIADNIRFSSYISDPDRDGPAFNPIEPATLDTHKKFLRPDGELAALTGRAWLEEPRVAADGTPDLEQWARPQDDGPALRASSVMSVLADLPETASPEADALIERDLAHVAAVAGRPCIGPWEETPPRRTTFTLIVEWDALDRGAKRAEARGTSGAHLREGADRVAALIEEAADPVTGGWRESLEAPAGKLDSATILAILHAGRRGGPFALAASRTRATVAALETIFADLYPINRGRSVPAIGRWKDDVYFDGNPWYPTTLGFAELHYHVAADSRDATVFAKAEGWMRLIQDVAPEGTLDLPEQFDRRTGAPTSCRALTWSAAAFLEADAARQRALQAMASSR